MQGIALVTGNHSRLNQDSHPTNQEAETNGVIPYIVWEVCLNLSVAEQNKYKSSETLLRCIFHTLL